jgi:hypothetical protein
MGKSVATTKTLESLRQSFDESLQLTPFMQCDIKGGCSNCEDNRRPPRGWDRDGDFNSSGNRNGNRGR